MLIRFSLFSLYAFIFLALLLSLLPSYCPGNKTEPSDIPLVLSRKSFPALY